MKRSLPSMRTRKRYMVFEAVQDMQDTQSGLAAAKASITNAARKLIGEAGLAKSNLAFFPDWSRRRGIACISRESVGDIRAGLCFTSNPKIRTIGISGTVKKARERYLI